MRPVVVVPGGVSETFIDSKGREHTVYRMPLPSEGPIELTVQSGRRVLVYMFAHFVFTWGEGMTQVDIAHGTIRGDRMRVWDGIPLRGKWSADRLADFGQRWVRDQLAKFSPGGG